MHNIERIKLKQKNTTATLPYRQKKKEKKKKNENNMTTDNIPRHAQMLRKGMESETNTSSPEKKLDQKISSNLTVL